jgi:hypothetical protein
MNQSGDLKTLEELPAEQQEAANNKAAMSYEELGDFSVKARVLKITGLAITIGALAAVAALVLLRLISFFTNIFYFGRFSQLRSNRIREPKRNPDVALPVDGKPS